MDENFYWLRFLSPKFDKDDGGGGGGDDPPKDPPEDEGEEDGDDGGDSGDDDDEDDAEVAYQALLKKYNGNVERAGLKLQRRNYSLRQTNRKLREEIDAYKRHGKPSEVEAKLKERNDLATFKTVTERKEKIREVANVVGWDDVVLFDQLPDHVDAFVDLEGEEGKEKTKVAKVKYKDGEETKTESLNDYVKKHLERYLPALEKTKRENDRSKRFPRQHTGGGGDSESRATTFLGNRYKKPKAQ